VSVTVDHAGQQGESGALQNLAVTDNRGVSGGADPGDAIVIDEYRGVSHRLPALSVD
jgi:hypothetical protein